MSPHLEYLKYVLRHKWYVFRECLRLDVPLHQAVLHDWSKFLPSEWFPYVRNFYDKANARPGEFVRAWNAHQKRNPHHWQYWLVTRDTGETTPLPIPLRYVREMVADWAGAGLAIAGTLDVAGWYAKNRDRIVLDGFTREQVESLIRVHYSGAPKPRQTYRHFKGTDYKIIAVAEDSETREGRVVYQCVGGGLVWDRPLAVFNETLPDGRKRFTRLS